MPEGIPARGRRGGWTTLGISILALWAAVIASGIGYSRWANTLPPPEPDPRPPLKDNGFDAVIAVAGKLRPLSIRGNEQQWLLDHAAAVRRGSPAENAALADLRPAARRDLRLPDDGDGLDPAFDPLNNALRRLIAASWVALADGDRPLAVERALTGLELGSRLGRGGLLSYGVVSSAIARVIAGTLEPCVPDLSAAEARAAGARLDAVLARLPSHAEVLRGHRRFALNRFARELEQGSPAMLARTVPVWLHQSSLRPFYWSLYPKPNAYAAADGYYRSLIQQAERPFPQRRPVPVPEETLARVQVAGVEAAVQRLVAAETAVILLRLELALQEYRKTRGRYPDRLEALVPTVLASIPTDPFTGKPFIYRPSGARCLLYSAGSDRKDDAGRPAPPLPAPGDLVAGRLVDSLPQQ